MSPQLRFESGDFKLQPFLFFESRRTTNRNLRQLSLRAGRRQGGGWFKKGVSLRRVTSTPDPDTFEKYRIHLPFLSRYFCKSMSSSWQKGVYTPSICITIRLPFVLRYFCRSIRVRGRWNTPNSRCAHFLPNLCFFVLVLSVFGPSRSCRGFPDLPLSGPISRDTAILSLRYHISRDTFSGRSAAPQNGAIPSLGT